MKIYGEKERLSNRFTAKTAFLKKSLLFYKVRTVSGEAAFCVNVSRVKIKSSAYINER